MGYEYSSPNEPDKAEDIQVNEIAYVWPEEIRNQRYKELVGELPSPSLSEEQIAYGILHPEKEQERVRALNREEDKGETTSTYRRKSS